MKMILRSQETIKPSSPTPSHLKIHNLSVTDKYNLPVHIPMIFFFKNYNNINNGDILKKSLSQCLTQYYPFAGRFRTASSPDHVNCNDAGVEFLEASIDSRLDEFVVKKEHDEALDQLLPHSLGCSVNQTSTNIAKIQLTRFNCGGVALGVSIAHKVIDVFTMVNFINHWATVTRGETPLVKLSFFSSSTSSSISNNYDEENTTTPEQEVVVKGKVKYAARRFVFSNSKLNELKNKIKVNTNRVDLLTSLVFKCAMSAARTLNSSSGCSQQSNLLQVVNLRGSVFPKLGAGNMNGMSNATINADSSGKVELEDVINSLVKERMELQGVRDVEEIGKKWVEIMSSIIGDGGNKRSYFSVSTCGFPIYQVDFGWGNPVRAVVRGGNDDARFFIFMDTPSGDGIEATVNLEEEEMAILQHDQELLAYTQQDI